jgi:pyridoxamine 5'-phosphate oxidase
MSVSHNEFIKHILSADNLDANPHKQFSKWLDDLMQIEDNENVAMSLSTIDSQGFPSSRILYLRYFTSESFIFFTNFKSNKGKEIEINSNASLLFYWPELERQVRVWGNVDKVESEVSDNYFKTRPKSSKASAWVSDQSRKIDGRMELEKSHQALLQNAGDKLIPRPDFWGGFKLTPIKYEFWQGRKNRLHDRFLYTLIGKNWEIIRLAP